MRWLERVKQWLKPPRSERAVRAREFATRDFITVGGRTRRVTQVRHIYGGVHLTLHTGELLVLARDARYQATQDRPKQRAPAPPDEPQTGPRDTTAPRPHRLPPTPTRFQEPAPPTTHGDTPHLTIGLTGQGRSEPTHGQCWLCDIADVPVIWLGPIQLVAHTVPLMACQPCTQHLYDRAHAHDRARDSRGM